MDKTPLFNKLVPTSQIFRQIIIVQCKFVNLSIDLPYRKLIVEYEKNEYNPISPDTICLQTD